MDIYLEMLTFVLAFGLISFSDSTQTGFTGDYSQLVLHQRSPAAVIYDVQLSLHLKPSMANIIAVEVLKEIGTYKSNTWIIDNLWATKNFRPLTNCNNGSLENLVYHDASLGPNFKTDLENIWPSLDENLIEDVIWKKSYDIYGSCIQSTPLDYFKNATNLLHNRNIGVILAGFQIYPGITYDARHVFIAIKNTLDAVPYLMCNSFKDEQYLSGVQICFNTEYQLEDCDYYVSDLCDLTKSVFYPGSPEH